MPKDLPLLQCDIYVPHSRCPLPRFPPVVATESCFCHSNAILDSSVVLLLTFVCMSYPALVVCLCLRCIWLKCLPSSFDIQLNCVMGIAHSLLQINCDADRRKAADIRELKDSYEIRLTQIQKSAKTEISRLVSLLAGVHLSFQLQERERARLQNDVFNLHKL